MIWAIVGLITAWGVIDAIAKTAKEVGAQTTVSGVVCTVLATVVTVGFFLAALIGISKIL